MFNLAFLTGGGNLSFLLGQQYLQYFSAFDSVVSNTCRTEIS